MAEHAICFHTLATQSGWREDALSDFPASLSESIKDQSLIALAIKNDNTLPERMVEKFQAIPRQPGIHRQPLLASPLAHLSTPAF